MAVSGPITLKLTGDEIVGSGYRLELDGKDISAQVTGITVTLNVAEVNQAEIRYACDRIEIDGKFQIVHRCPLEEQ
jgi:hypothetical protein